MNIIVEKSRNKTFTIYIKNKIKIKNKKWSWEKYLTVVKIPFDRNESCSAELIATSHPWIKMQIRNRSFYLC
jgi:hypothetical protein